MLFQELKFKIETIFINPNNVDFIEQDELLIYKLTTRKFLWWTWTWEKPTWVRKGTVIIFSSGEKIHISDKSPAEMIDIIEKWKSEYDV